MMDADGSDQHSLGLQVNGYGNFDWQSLPNYTGPSPP